MNGEIIRKVEGWPAVLRDGCSVSLILLFEGLEDRDEGECKARMRAFGSWAAVVGLQGLVENLVEARRVEERSESGSREV